MQLEVAGVDLDTGRSISSDPPTQGCSRPIKWTLEPRLKQSDQLYSQEPSSLAQGSILGLQILHSVSSHNFIAQNKLKD